MDDLLEFYDDQWKTVVSNLKNLTSTMSIARPKSPPVPIQGISYAIGERSLSIAFLLGERCYDQRTAQEHQQYIYYHPDMCGSSPPGSLD